QAIVVRSDCVWASSLQRDNPMQLPVTQPAAGRIRIRQEVLALAEGQIPAEIADEAVANVEVGIALFRGIVVSVLRKRSGRKVVAKISQAVAEGITQGVAQPLGHPPLK